MCIHIYIYVYIVYTWMCSKHIQREKDIIKCTSSKYNFSVNKINNIYGLPTTCTSAGGMLWLWKVSKAFKTCYSIRTTDFYVTNTKHGRRILRLNALNNMRDNL